MQYDPNKQGYNNYGNQYPPMNQPPYGAGNIYQPNNAPPPYTQYPQHSSAYPTAVYQPPTVTVVPLYRPLWNYLTPTPITSSLRVFFIISGLLYLIWGILAVGLEIGILIYSYWRYYTGFWTAILVFFIIANIHTIINMSVAGKAQRSTMSGSTPNVPIR
ncbi:unnamed protein product [Rotaria sordida]|uniref:Uncharacterized protein n=1 Tax=Rotaria sordida TaxID=392033 RepID=A0A819KGP1_9BILA|nr:unnamed protein product [Rotaria sordida]CAF0867548.1 unnamed protein product [Rotaria sordida]CAF0873286.1 unnamed protein product [Rotaria sordida]CAF0947308.1 unnamed protein product [Rotaria sordida]CAF0951205.1 unnamed protein product [Rotaria sordida]